MKIAAGYLPSKHSHHSHSCSPLPSESFAQHLAIGERPSEGAGVADIHSLHVAEVPQDGLAEITWKQIKREIESLPICRYYTYGSHRRQDFQILPNIVK